MRALAAKRCANPWPLIVAGLLVGGCAPSLALVREHFPDHERLQARLDALQGGDPELVGVVRIGRSHEGRDIPAVRIGGHAGGRDAKPAMLAVFSEHGDEHDTAALALGLIERLVRLSRAEPRVAAVLARTELWLVPMMNPDGAQYDLSGAGPPFSWRKNRRPTGDATIGVDLNRNWGYAGDPPAPGPLARHLTDPASDTYAGEAPWSEPETRALRELLLGRPNIRLVVDYHSGAAGFLQGGTGCFSSDPQWQYLHVAAAAACESLIDGFAAAITDVRDARPGFVVVRREQDIADAVRRHAPLYLKPFIPERSPKARGVSGEYVYGALGIVAIGVEIFRAGTFFDDLPSSQAAVTDSQLRGVLFLLEALDPGVPAREESEPTRRGG